MLPLPVNPYEPAAWSSAKVPNDYTISDGRNRYSVPFDLIGETVDIRLTRDTVEVFFHGGRVASHTPQIAKDYIHKMEHELFFLWEYIWQKGLGDEAQSHVDANKDEPIPFSW